MSSHLRALRLQNQVVHIVQAEGTRKSFELIFISLPSVIRPAWVALNALGAHEDLDATFACTACSFRISRSASIQS
jgi:hypothetical protein